MNRRLFIAILLPEELKKKLAEAKKYFTGLPEPVRPHTKRTPRYGVGARWIKPENLHLTVLFLGWVGEDLLSKIKGLLSLTIVNNGRHFDLTLEKIILAPPGKPPRMVWALFRRSPELEDLKHRIYRELGKTGLRIKEEKREFQPHITLCRFPEAGRRPFEGLPGLKISAGLPVKSIALMESKLSRWGADYWFLDRYQFPR